MEKSISNLETFNLQSNQREASYSRMPNSSHKEKGNKADSSKVDDLHFNPPDDFKKEAYFTSYHQYKKIYRFSVEDSERFWSNTAKELYWFKLWKEIKQGKAFNSKWFIGAKTNIAYNCLDVHLDANRRNKAALIWESEDGETKIFTYQLLFTQVAAFANVLKKHGVGKGDNVLIFMGMVPEAVIAMLACARIGAVHSVIYSGLSAKALENRVGALKCEVIITQDYAPRKGNFIPVKENVNKAIENLNFVKHVIVYQRNKDASINLHNREHLWSEELMSVSADCNATEVIAQHPVFSMFTNGPKGDLVKILHRTGGYMVQAYLSSKWIFDLKDGDIFWSTSDIGWISGHTYSIYGPLLNGITTFIYEGSPIYPEPDRFWQIISKYRINIFHTAPTTLRGLLKQGDEWIEKHDLSSIKLLGTKGEPIKVETWLWYYRAIGKLSCPVVNTWLQTETGSILISPFPGASGMKPGYTCCPFPGIELDIVDIKGIPVKDGEGGYLIVKDSWPSMFFTDKEEKAETKLNCWNQFKGSYFTGDAAVKEKNGYIKILGRVDDVIKTGGHRVGGSEIEKILLNHESVKEAVIVKRPDEVIGNAIIAFVSLKKGFEGTLLLKEELRNYVQENIGAIAKPNEMRFLDTMPKLDNGKTNRHILREKAIEGTYEPKGEEAGYFRILENLREEYQKIYLE
ncbi:acetyl-coenzyme A synthetase [bacterium BMS3Abin03]|nr:acetyl-coenzyme A synthetase [bacterium BMS3Abin03]